VSGYCPDCGNTLCVCAEMEAENKRHAEEETPRLYSEECLKAKDRIIRIYRKELLLLKEENIKLDNKLFAITKIIKG